MRTALFLAGACAVLLAVTAAPAPDPAASPAAAPAPIDDNTPEIIEIIAPAASAQETLATLNLGAPGAELSERNKRTIGILRSLFPTLTQIIEKKVQQITSVVLQTLGPVVLRTFLGGNRGGGVNGGGGGTVDIEDDDEDEDEDTAEPTTASPERRRRALRFRPEAPEQQQNLLTGAESQPAEVRVAFDGDQQAAAQTNSATIDEISLEDVDGSEENRNKRFLGFSSSSGNGNGAASAGGGSGNFLFDIVRLVAGSSSGLSGGGEAPATDGGDGDDAGAAKGDNLTEGVPGPITRLFIIANRGIANLVQDLILRLAQTSERIVNFKARLITSII